jgi:hypothetical protein
MSWPKLNTAAVVQQALQPLQGGVLPFGAVAQAIARAAAQRAAAGRAALEGEAIETLAADQSLLLTDQVHRLPPLCGTRQPATSCEQWAKASP